MAKTTNTENPAVGNKVEQLTHIPDKTRELATLGKSPPFLTDEHAPTQ